MNRPASWRSLTAELIDRQPFRIGGATVDPVSRDAKWSGGQERLQPQTLKVLVTLASRRGAVVTRDELVQLCWDGRIVGDDVINRSISLLRHFAERAGGFAIETVPRAGYRLVEGKPRQSPVKRWWIPGAVVGLLLCGAGYLAIERFDSRPSAATPVVALLPFETNSSDPAVRALTFAAHDSVAHMLSQTELPVKLAGAPHQPGDASADYEISADVSGSPTSLIATVRMEDTAHHVIVYSHRFEASRAQASILPDRIGAQVAGSLGWPTSLIALDRAHSDPTIVTQLYRQPEVEQMDPLEGYDNARRVAAKAPDSAIAQMSLAMGTSFALGEIPREQRSAAVLLGRSAAEKILSLAPGFGDGYIPWCVLHSSVRWSQCEDRLRAGIKTDPDAPFVDTYLGRQLGYAGRLSEGLEFAKRSLAHDPTVPSKNSIVVRLLEATGQTQEANELYTRAGLWWPEFQKLKWRRFYGMAERGDFEAIRRFEQELGPANLPTHYQPTTAIADAVAAHSLSAARTACPLTSVTDFKAMLCMLAFARLGDAGAAYVLANRLYPARVGRTAAEEDRIFLDQPAVPDTEFLTASSAAPLRRDPRYLQLAGRLGLLAYWRSGRAPDFCTKAHETVCAQIFRKS